ncbi:MAG: hypothetical protein AAF384_11740 [Pseudomonadota bacterium]
MSAEILEREFKQLSKLIGAHNLESLTAFQAMQNQFNLDGTEEVLIELEEQLETLNFTAAARTLGGLAQELSIEI